MTPNHPKVNYGKTGILIVNLGTPDSTNWLDIRNFENTIWGHHFYAAKESWEEKKIIGRKD